MFNKSLFAFALLCLGFSTTSALQAQVEYSLSVEDSSLTTSQNIVTKYREMLDFEQPFPEGSRLLSSELKDSENYVADTLIYLGDEFYTAGMSAVQTWNGKQQRELQKIIQKHIFKDHTLISIEDGTAYFSVKVSAGFSHDVNHSSNELLTHMFFIPALHYYFAAYQHEDTDEKETLNFQISSLLKFLCDNSLKVTVDSALKTPEYQRLYDGISELPTTPSDPTH